MKKNFTNKLTLSQHNYKLKNLPYTKTRKLSLRVYFTLILTIFLIFLIPSGCKNKFSKLLSYSTQNIPKNLDPQTATDSNEISVVNNIFEGLYKRNLDGSFSLAAAQNVQKDNNSTKYIFTIKKNNIWQLNSTNKTIKKQFERPINASDFEFAFKRLLNPETKSPFAQNYYFIKNAQQIHTGKLSPDNLGIYSKNDQLIVELEHPVPNLEELLSLAPTMPCNKEFFNYTKGRYGLNLDTVLCNGKFYVHQWPQNQKIKKLRLRVNKNNPDSNNIKILGINLSQRTKLEAFKLINKNEIDSAIFNATEFNLNKIYSNNKQIFQNSTCGIIFNQNNMLFQNNKIKKALAMSTNHEQIKNSLNTNTMTKAYGIVPNSVNINKTSYRKLTNNVSPLPKYDPELAKSLFKQGLTEIQNKNSYKNNTKNKKSNKQPQVNLNNFSILVQENNYNLINELLQNWQQTFNLYLKIQVCNNDDYLTKLKNQNFDCAIITIENDFNSPSCTLNQFTNYYDNNTLPELQSLLGTAAKANNEQDMANVYFEAEQKILHDGAFIPLFHPNKAFVLNKNFKNVLFINSCKQLYFEFTQPKK